MEGVAAKRAEARRQVQRACINIIFQINKYYNSVIHSIGSLLQNLDLDSRRVLVGTTGTNGTGILYARDKCAIIEPTSVKGGVETVGS